LCARSTARAPLFCLDALRLERHAAGVPATFYPATDDFNLFQPVFVRVRDDKVEKACDFAQFEGTNRAVADADGDRSHDAGEPWRNRASSGGCVGGPACTQAPAATSLPWCSKTR
jgi:hypothetical protein